jgi:hypothetical protein
MVALSLYDKRKEFPKMKLWELGQFLPQFKHHFVMHRKTAAPLDTDVKKVIEATVSRYLKKAVTSIQNTSLGLFP